MSVAVSILVGSIVSLLLYGSGFLSLFTPFPFSFLVLRKGFGVAAIAALLAGILLFGAYSWDPPPFFLPGMVFHPFLANRSIQLISLLVFVFYLSLGGSILYWSSRARGWSLGIFQVLLSTLATTALVYFIFSQIFNVSIAADLHSGLSFLSGRLIEANQEWMREDLPVAPEWITHVFWNLLPGFWISWLLFVAAMNIAMIRRWVDPHFLDQWGDYARWRLNEQLIWVPLLLGGVYLLNHLVLDQGAVRWILLNFIAIFLAVYFFQGISIGVYFARQKLTPLIRMMILFLLLLFFQPFALFLVLVGLFDFWFDFRKLRQ